MISIEVFLINVKLLVNIVIVPDKVMRCACDLIFCKAVN